MRIAVVGAGYVGLVTAAGFSELGNDVVCVDKDEQRIALLRRHKVPIVEPGLEELVNRNAEAGRLRFFQDLREAVADIDALFIAVGTPSRIDGGADLSAVFDVADVVVEHASQEMVLVLKSTVPVGTNERVQRIVREASVPIHVVSNPEFLKEGDAVTDFLHPDRIVVGYANGDGFARRVMERLYRPLQLDRDRLLWMSPPSAELTKYAANTMLAMRISFINEIAALCEQVGADIQQIRAGVGSDPRIGPKFLYASPGYGGSCFPKDVKALVQTGREHGIELELASSTHRVNQRQKGVLLRKLKRHFEGDLRHRRIAVWGVTFKPRTDDVRQSPALTLIDSLLAEGAEVVAHDPAVREAILSRFEGRVRAAEEAYDAAHDADALVLVTEWRQYQSPDFQRLKETMRGDFILDGRNVWTSEMVREYGLNYEGIGAAR